MKVFPFAARLSEFLNDLRSKERFKNGDLNETDRVGGVFRRSATRILHLRRQHCSKYTNPPIIQVRWNTDELSMNEGTS